MIGDTVKCENTGCDVEFAKKTHNQKYHDDECCRLATNKKIMEKYYARKSQRAGADRMCVSCGETKLSRYNPGDTCHSCAFVSHEKRNEQVATTFMNVVWL